MKILSKSKIKKEEDKEKFTLKFLDRIITCPVKKKNSENKNCLPCHNYAVCQLPRLL